MRSKIDNKKYQVFLLRSRAHFPFIFADHIWFVVNKKGNISRWEITFRKYKGQGEYWGYLHKDFFPSFQGLHIFSFYQKLRWPSKLLYMVEGAESSIAEKMVKFIENSPNNYPYINKYSIFGPNCGTYVKWVLNNFPEFDFKLKNYIGADYNK